MYTVLDCLLIERLYTLIIGKYILCHGDVSGSTLCIAFYCGKQLVRRGWYLKNNYSV